MVFIVNFIILVCTCLGSCNKQGACNFKVLPYLSQSSKLDKIDWCAYVLNCLKEEKLVWSRNEIKTIFNGPCEFLTLLYVDRIQCNQMPFVRRFPVINFWTSDQLKFREIKELESGGFGNGVVANYNEDFESRSILDFVSNIQWVVYDLNKKVEMTLQKHGSHKKFQLYRLKLQEIVSVFTKFNQSDVENVSSSDSLRRKINFEDDSFKHQGKEIGKRFLNEDITSFVLGIESELYTPKKPCLSSGHKMQEKSISKGIFDSPVNVMGKNLHVPSFLSKRDQNQLPSKSRPKRDQMLPPVRRSPYVIRAVPIDTTLTKEENIISNWVFSLVEDPMDNLFLSIFGQRGERHMFESLYPHEHLFYGTIDCFVDVLNYDERARNKDTPSCFFFKTCILNPGYMHIKGTKSEEEYKIFKENVLQCLGVSEDRRSLKGFDMKYMFGRYLLEINHNMVFSVQYEIDFFDQYMTWKTRGNSNDCGIFLMRHMETYKGGPLAQWECGFKKEGADQLHKIRKLRRRYCLKILLSEVNIMKPEVENLIGQYQRMSHDDRRKLYLDGIVKIGARLVAFGP
ncbi:unnamed protein product [Lactuca virosa]|uniref:Ubiquitin-like protease family profile domain-containing protein n=1 Tax=Lactuca virosa TaxID=75947 RepID=A0AAU9NQR3_9ASTR|nr:unnamed protein product [Lactuca virosa]